MNLCRLNVACALAGLLIVAGFVAAYGQQPSSSGGRKIEFSDPGRSVVVSNLNSITKEDTVFQNPEDELKKPFELFSPGSSLQGIGAPPMQRMPSSTANSKRLKEVLEKRQEWIYLRPEDYNSQQTIEEIFGIPEYGPNGEAKERKSPLERYYERLERGNAPTNRTRNDGLFGSGFDLGKKTGDNKKGSNITGMENDPNEPGDVAESDNPLTHLLRGNPSNPLVPDRTRSTGFTDVFGQQNSEWKPDSPEALRAQAARLEEFKRILDMSTLPSSSSVSGIAPFDPLKLPTSPSTSPVFAFPKNTEPVPATPVAPVRDSLSPFPTAVGAMGVVARPVGLPEISTSVPGLTPSTPATLPEPARTVVPTPDFNIPKRRFN